MGAALRRGPTDLVLADALTKDRAGPTDLRARLIHRAYRLAAEAAVLEALQTQVQDPAKAFPSHGQ
eukprot:13073961-Alexandrium_andersonii.AAC.1